MTMHNDHHPHDQTMSTITDLLAIVAVEVADVFLGRKYEWTAAAVAAAAFDVTEGAVAANGHLAAFVLSRGGESLDRLVQQGLLVCRTGISSFGRGKG